MVDMVLNQQFEFPPVDSLNYSLLVKLPDTLLNTLIDSHKKGIDSDITFDPEFTRVHIKSQDCSYSAPLTMLPKDTHFFCLQEKNKSSLKACAKVHGKFLISSSSGKEELLQVASNEQKKRGENQMVFTEKLHSATEQPRRASVSSSKSRYLSPPKGEIQKQSKVMDGFAPVIRPKKPSTSSPKRKLEDSTSQNEPPLKKKHIEKVLQEDIIKTSPTEDSKKEAPKPSDINLKIPPSTDAPEKKVKVPKITISKSDFPFLKIGFDPTIEFDENEDDRSYSSIDSCAKFQEYKKIYEKKYDIYEVLLKNLKGNQEHFERLKQEWQDRLRSGENKTATKVIERKIEQLYEERKEVIERMRKKFDSLTRELKTVKDYLDNFINDWINHGSKII